MRRFEVSEGSRKVWVELLSKVPGILEGPCDLLRQPESSTDQKKSNHVIKVNYRFVSKSRRKSDLVPVRVRGKVVESCACHIAGKWTGICESLFDFAL